MAGTYPKTIHLSRTLTLPDPSGIEEANAKGFGASLVRIIADFIRDIYDDLKESRTYRYTPTSSSDSAGLEGDVAYDNSFVYVKANGGWRRAALSTF
jgi:hypothetical protein